MQEPFLDRSSQFVAATTESLPSLHLFAEIPGDHGPFIDLEFLKNGGPISSHASGFSDQTQRECGRPDVTRRREEFLVGLEALMPMLRICAGKPGANVLLLSHAGQAGGAVEDMLSAVALEHGYRVVLVELGLTRNHVGQDAEGEGLLNCLSNFALHDQLFSWKPGAGLHRVPRGTATSHPLSLLLSPRFRRLNTLLAGRFDLVFYRSCYATEALETFAVAKVIRPSVVIVAPRENIGSAKEMRDELAVLDTPLLGVLI